LRFNSKRSFFASSTDHTQLLSNAEVHKLTTDGGYQLVLAAQGMDLDTIKKVPQLHLARLFVLNDTMYGAKVVNRTLGSPTNVCTKLVQMALDQDPSIVQAKSTLHGLSEWVLDLITRNQIHDSSFTGDIQLLENIARDNTFTNEEYRKCKSAWENLAIQFTKEQIEAGAGEAALYAHNGATLSSIEHHSDISEFQNTCAGAMALFSFSNK